MDQFDSLKVVAIAVSSLVAGMFFGLREPGIYTFELGLHNTTPIPGFARLPPAFPPLPPVETCFHQIKFFFCLLPPASFLCPTSPPSPSFVFSLVGVLFLLSCVRVGSHGWGFSSFPPLFRSCPGFSSSGLSSFFCWRGVRGGEVGH